MIAPQACSVSGAYLVQQLLDTFFEELAVELLRMLTQRHRAKQRLMHLKKLYGLLERCRRPRRKQNPRRGLLPASIRAQRAGALRLIGWDHGLKSPPPAECNHRTSGGIRLKRHDTKILLRWEDDCPTRRVILTQLFIRAPAEELNVRAGQRFELRCQWPAANDSERATQGIKRLDRQVDTFIGH